MKIKGKFKPWTSKGHLVLIWGTGGSSIPNRTKALWILQSHLTCTLMSRHDTSLKSQNVWEGDLVFCPSGDTGVWRVMTHECHHCHVRNSGGQFNWHHEHHHDWHNTYILFNLTSLASFRAKINVNLIDPPELRKSKSTEYGTRQHVTFEEICFVCQQTKRGFQN